MNWPICVAEEHILKLHFSQFVEKIPCIYFILYLQARTKNKQTKQPIKKGSGWSKNGDQSLASFERYLLLLFEKFEHAFHVDERILDHSAAD